MQFQGVIPIIFCHVSKWGAIELRVIYQKEFWDILVDFDVVERHSSGGRYYCALCEKPEIFSSRQDLWEKHSFESLLEWTNRRFTETTWICLFGARGDCTEAILKEEHELEAARNREDFADAFPVVK
ncbi:MAG: hypothetical protein V1736_05285 [Pseudomonadota bacterium]